jgi:hypothetical protein
VTTKLAVFNNCLGELGHRRLSDTGEAVEAGREIVAVYDQVVAEAIASGSWNFAMETIKADADTGVTPEFGFPKVFAKPSDWVRTIGVSQDEYFAYPLLHYYDDDNFWSADNTPIYVRYVSNDTGLGLDLQRWTAHFARFVELHLADRVCMRLTQKESLKERIAKDRDKARRTALNHDAQNEASPKFPPPSSWTRSRWGSSGGHRDRGSRGSLIG